MLTIHKHAIPVEDSFALDLPLGFRVLKLDAQRETPQLWVLVDDQAPKRLERFELRGTGHDCTGLDKHTYVGTFLLRGGALVFHVFHLPIGKV
jgi:hypothetical protein